MKAIGKFRILRRIGAIGLMFVAAGILPVGSATPTSSASQVTGGSGWGATAAHLRGQNGSRFTYGCPANGAPYRVWGTNVYTDDSSVCTAAVHAGRITLAKGGTVTIEIRAGQSSYASSTRNGIKSGSWGSWHGSFVVVGATASTGHSSATGGSGWRATAIGHRGQINSRFTYRCPAGGTPYRVWGSTVYTDDSSVCTAAVHAGRITLAKGGIVKITIRPGRSSYAGTTRHGIASRPWGRWGGSFVFV
jgi:hypothetical protein